jgi:hypothetical protein
MLMPRAMRQDLNMPEDASSAGARQRRRRRPSRESAPAPGTSPQAAPSSEAPARRARRDGGGGGGGGGLRDIVGAGRSQLGVSGALRARHVDRPTAEDLAEAEREVNVVRRNWRPDPSK